ncbi:MAG: hypothetical protein KJ060_11660 [Candidatus Hydrogenedentes bacterium]|nr:hypothetical protein [Candidatus Hydrogenedentota bacterium]
MTERGNEQTSPRENDGEPHGEQPVVGDTPADLAEHHEPPRAFLAVAIGVILLLVIAILSTFYFLRPTQSPATPTVSAGELEPSPDLPPVPDLPPEPAAEAIDDQAEASPTSAPEPEPEPLDLALAGTVLGGSPAAVLRDTVTGQQKVYRVGDVVKEGVTLTEVYEKEVVLDRDGESFRLTLGPFSMEAQPPRGIDGLWKVVLAMDGSVEDYGDLLTFHQDGDRVEVTDEHGETFASGTLDERELMLQFKEGDGLFVLRGELAWSQDYVVMKFDGATPYGDGVDPESLELRFTKVPEDEEAILATLRERKQEVEQIRNALMAYARDHEGLFPATLDMLMPGELSRSTPYTTNEERRVTYDGQHRIAVPNLAEAPRFDTFRQYLPLGERLTAYDEVLRTQHGGDEWLEPATILTIEYTGPSVTYTVTARGDLHEQVHQDGWRANDTVPDEGTINAWITQDQKNLQQLRIIMQMFQNENENYTPGGWVSVYPEYMTDPSVLTSPKDEPGTNSYLYLYPGTQVHDLIAQRAGDPDIWQNDRATADAIASEIPILLNRTDFPGLEPGRNVLYLDWHVSYVPKDSDEWRTYVEPHLRGKQ